MNNSIIYEAQPPQGISIVFIVVVLVFIILLLYGIGMCIKQPKTQLVGKIVIFFADAVILLCIVSVAIPAVDSGNKVWNRYLKGDYLVAKGIIDDYEDVKGFTEKDLRYDSFSVSDVEFHVPGFVTVWGYPLMRIEGGVLKNGMNVKIYYIPYKFENVIMKLELLEGQ